MATIVGGSGLAVANMKAAQQKAKKPVVRKTVAKRFMHTGTYGDISQIYHLLHQPGYVKGETIDVDLQGVPCRWLELQNGCVYKTYDMRTKYLK